MRNPGEKLSEMAADKDSNCPPTNQSERADFNREVCAGMESITLFLG
jgi:hypothetical protein